MNSCDDRDLGDGLAARLAQAEKDRDDARWEAAALRWQAVPHYTSTACQHNAHDRCRGFCTYCNAPCRCPCPHTPKGPPQ